MQYGLDQPLPVQYVELMRGIFGGSVECFSTCGNLRAEFLHRLPVTVWLALGATLLAAALATSLALLCVRFHGRRLDRLLLGVAAGLHSVPTLVLSTVLWTLLCRQAELFPYEGYVPLHEDPAGWAWHLALPWIAVALPFAGAYVPVLRAAMLEARSADWVRTARAKGLRERRSCGGTCCAPRSPRRSASSASTSRTPSAATSSTWRRSSASPESVRSRRRASAAWTSPPSSP